MKSNILAAAALVFFAANVLKAEEAPKPCKADAEKFCKDIKPGGGRLLACLRSHETELSAECRTKGLEAKEKIKALAETCKSDTEKFCKDVKGGPGKKAACLKDHEKELSEACKTAYARFQEEKQKSKPCAADLEKFCKDVKQGEGRIIACLKQHEAELSEACKAKQAERKEKREERKKERKERRGEKKDKDGGKKDKEADKQEAPAKPA